MVGATPWPAEPAPSLASSSSSPWSFWAVTICFPIYPTRLSGPFWRESASVVLLPLGIYFLIRAVKEPLRAYTSARKDWNESTVPAHLATDVVSCAALTMFNPLTIIYWVGVTANWLPLAHSILGSKTHGWGILMVAAGLMTWFTTLIVVVRFLPHRIGPTFFRLINGILGLILLGFATFCAIVLSRHFLH